MSTPLDAGPPHVWTNPAAPDDTPSLVALDADALLLAVVPKADLDKAAQGLREGQEVVAKNVPLDRLTRAEGVDGGSDLTLTYRVGAEKTESTELTFADPAARDEVLLALVPRLGAQWDFRRQAGSRLMAALMPLLGVAITALLTWALHAEALRPAGKVRGGWRRQLFRWLAQLLGPTGVLVLGGVVLAGCVVALCWALARPPVRLVLEPLPPPSA